jgi:stage V sporulation protein AC
MTSAAMDSRREGFVKGIGTNIFKLTGSIILYGIVVAFFVSLLKVIIG